MLNEIETILKKYHNLLGDNDGQFLKRVYSTEQSIYQKRLESIGFNGKKNVLDAGCGFGQWSLSLSHLNDKVFSIDNQADRVIIFNDIVSTLNLDNVKVKKGSLTELPYDDNSFDSIFCYGVIFCTDWKKTLTEFNRVLEPGGVLYFSANEIGWYLNLWNQEPNKANDYFPKDVAAESFLNTVKYQKYGIPPEKGQILITKDECKNVLLELDFTSPTISGEGTINISNNNVHPFPFFCESYDGMPACYEVLTHKNR